VYFESDGTRANSCYDFVLNLMRLMIEGAIDVFMYETDMQKVLGANAYITFSVEKILHNIFKQVSLSYFGIKDCCKSFN
jgi:histone deacetylase complex regulatory component SIN3